jgi:hypothetical protein
MHRPGDRTNSEHSTEYTGASRAARAGVVTRERLRLVLDPVCLGRLRQPVPVQRPATQVAALLSGLGRHRGPDPDPDPGAGDLLLAGQAEREHGLLVVLSVPGGVKVRRREWRT